MFFLAAPDAIPMEVKSYQSFEPGSRVDLTVLHQNPEATLLVDVKDMERPGGCWSSQESLAEAPRAPATA